MVGEMLGHYRVLSEISEGGMGLVYLAEHYLLKKKAAVKVLLPDLSRNEDVVSRFFNEARATTLVSHPGIVNIFDFGYHGNGTAYLVMELLEGESLAARLQRERVLSPALLIELSKQLAAALGAAHALGIVHRDLKPDNVFLSIDGAIPCGLRAKVLDFGIAKLASDGIHNMRTRIGAVMGSPAYMAPEQCRGVAQVDHRADIYALGCLMYEMAAGRPPFVRAGLSDILTAHIHEQPAPLHSLAPTLPLDLGTVVTRAMGKRPDDRYPSMAELEADLISVGARYGAPAPASLGPGGCALAQTVCGSRSSKLRSMRTLSGVASTGGDWPLHRGVRWETLMLLSLLLLTVIGNYSVIRLAIATRAQRPAHSVAVAVLPVKTMQMQSVPAPVPPINENVPAYLVRLDGSREDKGRLVTNHDGIGRGSPPRLRSKHEPAAQRESTPNRLARK
jgi:serine/threonine-protein kinase